MKTIPIVTEEQAIKLYETVTRCMREGIDLLLPGNSSPSWAMDRRYDVSRIGLVEFAESLSTDQLKQLCEAKGLSVVEWIEFDKDDESTWPDKSMKRICIKMVEDGTTIASRAWLIRFRKAAVATHWCELPQRKESKL